jgi:hypothetical protein
VSERERERERLLSVSGKKVVITKICQFSETSSADHGRVSCSFHSSGFFCVAPKNNEIANKTVSKSGLMITNLAREKHEVLNKFN